jgi:PAS domain S-box-containing protein
LILRAAGPRIDEHPNPSSYLEFTVTVRRLTLLQRLAAVLGPALVVVVFAVLLLRSMAEVRGEAAWLEHTHRIVQVLSVLRESVLDVETSKRGFLLTADSSYLEAQGRSAERAREALAELEALTETDVTQHSRADALAVLLEQRIEHAEQVAFAGGVARSALAPQLAQSREAMVQLRQKLDEIEAEQAVQLRQRQQAAEERLRAAAAFVLLAGAVAGLLALLTNLLITRHVRAREQSEQRVSEANRQLQSQADQLAAANDQLRAQSADLQNQTRELRESQSRFQRISDSNMVGVLFWTLDGPVTHANDRFLELVGYTREQLQRGEVDWRRLTPEEWRHADDAAIAEVLERGVSSPFEKEYLRGDGTRVPVLLSAARFEDGSDEGVTLIVDLSAQKAAVQELADARRHLRLALDSARLGTWELDVASGTTYWDDRTREVLGRPGDGLIATEDAVAAIHPDDRELSVAAFQDTIRSETLDMYEMEKRIVRPDGSVRWTVWTGLLKRDAEGTPVRMVGTLEDVTAVREAREQLRENEQRFRVMTEALPQIVWTADATGEVDFYNHRWREYSGVTPELGYGEGWRVVVHPEDEQATMFAWQHAVATGGPYEIEHRIRRHDGEFRWQLSRGVPLRDDAGNVVRWFGTATDIHEQKLLETELRAARDAAEAASQAKSQFLAVMSHELRTPLTAVIGFTDLLDTGVLGELTDQQRGPLKRISSSAWGLVQIIDEILTFSRADAGREQVRPASVEVVDLVRSAVDMLEPEAGRNGLTLSLEHEVPGITIHSDAGKIRQIVVNLVGNAVKFTECGEVRVAVLPWGGDGVEVRVTDTGPGIPPEQQDRIFEPFTQLDQTSTRVKGGTGLGLTVCRRLARLLGGEIAVESAAGRGSTFSLVLPRQPALSYADLETYADSRS